jgi:putative ABC transport system ATP-binding protein
MISSQQLTYTYPGSNPLVFPDFQCNASDILLLLGASGAGKTTLLHLLGGILSIQKGSIKIEGTQLEKLSPSAADQFRGQHIGIVFQQNHFVESLNAAENIYLAQTLAGRPRDKKRVSDLFSKLNIADKATSQVKDLSQGEKQRLAIARAFVNAPRLILADEPTSALDDGNCDEVIKLLKDQAAESGSALIVVTHDNRLKDIIPNRIILEKQ